MDGALEGRPGDLYLSIGPLAFHLLGIPPPIQTPARPRPDLAPDFEPMENVSNRPQNPILRQLANLKILSRLLAHEVHSQSTSKTLTLSRDEVSEIQTALELYIEDVSRRYSQAPSAGGVASVESPLAGVRN